MNVQNLFNTVLPLLVKISTFLFLKTSIEIYVIEEVKRRRIKLGISQAALADYLDISRGFIGDVENPRQKAKYNLKHINELAKILNCSPKDFLPSEPLEQ